MCGKSNGTVGGRRGKVKGVAEEHENPVALHESAAPRGRLQALLDDRTASACRGVRKWRRLRGQTMPPQTHLMICNESALIEVHGGHRIFRETSGMREEILCLLVRGVTGLAG